MNEWEYYVQCSRLKTKRRKERLRKWDSDKQLLRLYKELKRIRTEKADLGFKELAPPIQRGWKRIFTVRPDVALSKDGAFFQTLLEKINTQQLSHRRDFKVKRRRKGKKVYVEREQKLNEPEAWIFQRLKLTEKEKEYFVELRVQYPHGRGYYSRYVFKDPWRYVLKVLPNMITKVKVIDPLLEQREAEINAFLEGQNLWARISKLTDGYYRYKDSWNPKPKAKYQYLLKTEPIEEFYDELCNQNK